MEYEKSQDPCGESLNNLQVEPGYSPITLIRMRFERRPSNSP